MIDFAAVSPKKKSTKSSPELHVAPRYFDLEAAKRDLAPYKDQVDLILKRAEEIVITDDASNQEAITLAGNARTLSKAVEAAKLDKTAQYRDFVGKVNGFVKLFTDPLERTVKIVKSKTESYAYAQIVKQRKLEAEAREKAAKMQADLDAEAKKAGVQTVQLPDPVLPQANAMVRTESGSSMTIKLVWKAKITDPAAVPRQYCEPVQKRLDEAVAAGVREIPGCVIEEVPDSRLRA